MSCLEIRPYLQAFADEELLVGAWVVRNDRKLRITREFQIIRPSDQMTLVNAEVDYVCINIETGRATRMPEVFRELYVPCVI